MRLGHFVRDGLASSAFGFALIPSLTSRERWPPARYTNSNIRSFNFIRGGTTVALMER
jgi:hypothetical protein